MNDFEMQHTTSRFEQSVLAAAKILINLSIVLAAWQLRCARQSKSHLAATLGIKMIGFLASALGALVHARQTAFSNRKNLENGFSPAAGVHDGSRYVSLADGDLYRLNESQHEWEKAGTTTPRVALRMVPNGKTILVTGAASRNSDLIEAATVAK